MAAQTLPESENRLLFIPPLQVSGKFTPHKWRPRFADRRGGYWKIVDIWGDQIAVVYTHEADARLLASSKDLLASCIDLISLLRDLVNGGKLSRGDTFKVSAAIDAIRFAQEGKR